MVDYNIGGFLCVCFITFGLVYSLSFLLYKKNDKIKRVFYCSLIFIFFTLFKYIIFKAFHIRLRYLDYIFLLFSVPAFLTFVILLIKISKDRRKDR
jgi:Ca2+/Na+ antiporter